jgi:cytochrome c biogenesis protein CcdA
VSLLGAITPLGKVAHGRKLWLQCALAYIAAGAVSATIVGLSLGQVGHWLGWRWTAANLYLVSLLSLVLAAREWGWINFRLPERRTQTEKVWAHQFGFVIASAMWGFHIGLGFATWVTFGGFLALVALAVVLGSPLYGGILMLVYWLGRALPLLLAPSLVSSSSLAVELPTTILRSRSTYRRIAGFVLMWSCGATLLAALRIQLSQTSLW